MIDNKADEGFIKGLQSKNDGARKIVFRMVDKYDSISSSFTWRITKEGHSYWDNLNDEFNKIIRGK